MSDLSRRDAIMLTAGGAAGLLGAETTSSATQTGNLSDVNSRTPDPTGGAVPYRRLNKEDAAVLFVDHQTGLTALVQDYSPSDFKNAVVALADTAKFFELPAVLTTSFEQSPNGPMLPEVKERFPNAPFIARPGEINAWDNPDFVKAVEATGRKQLIIAGIVTEVCVAFPALAAREAGYEVFVCTDASGTFDEPTRQAAWMRMAAAGVQLVNWFSIASELHRDWRNDVEGFGKLLADHTPVYEALMKGFQAAGGKMKAGG